MGASNNLIKAEIDKEKESKRHSVKNINSIDASVEIQVHSVHNSALNAIHNSPEKKQSNKHLTESHSSHKDHKEPVKTTQVDTKKIVDTIYKKQEEKKLEERKLLEKQIEKKHQEEKRLEEKNKKNEKTIHVEKKQSEKKVDEKKPVVVEKKQSEKKVEEKKQPEKKVEEKKIEKPVTKPVKNTTPIRPGKTETKKSDTKVDTKINVSKSVEMDKTKIQNGQILENGNQNANLSGSSNGITVDSGKQDVVKGEKENSHDEEEKKAKKAEEDKLQKEKQEKEEKEAKDKKDEEDRIKQEKLDKEAKDKKDEEDRIKKEQEEKEAKEKKAEEDRLQKLKEEEDKQKEFFTVKVDETKSEVEQKFMYKRTSIINPTDIPSFSDNLTQALYIAGSSNLLKDKLRYQLLTLSPQIFSHSKRELVNILKEKREVVQGNISMYKEILEKYRSPVS